jgi:hypothetical protein
VRARLAAAAVCLLFARAAIAAEGRALEVASWLTGTFESDGPAAAGAAPEAVRIVIVAVPKSRIANGALVVYREQGVAPKPDEPSEQRFYRLDEDGDAVRMRAFDPKDPLIVRGKWRDPSVLALYGANDMRERPGCVILLRKSADRWEGGTQGAGCPSTRRTAATMTTALIVSRDGFLQWDRGFDEKGRQAWGSAEGGTRFAKRSAAAPVDDRLMERPVGRRIEEKAKAGFSAKVNEPAAKAPAALTITSPSSPSKKYDLTELRAMAGSGSLPLSRLFSTSDTGEAAATVIVVTSHAGGASAFSSAEIFSSSAGAPSLDVSSSALRLVAAGGRGLDDIVSIELRVLAPAK